MMYDWLYSSHWCLVWRCLHWGIAHSSLMMIFVRWQFMPDTYFPEIILHWGLTHSEMMHSHWGIATLPILTLRLHFLFMIAALDGLYSHWHPGLSLLSIPSLIWVPTFLCYTPIHPTFGTGIAAPILSEPYIFWAHIFHRLTWPCPFLWWSGEDMG